jgi:hypothetical protein
MHIVGNDSKIVDKVKEVKQKRAEQPQPASWAALAPRFQERVIAIAIHL